MALSPQQRLFAHEYVIDFNGKQAAIRAGYSAATAGVQASRLLRRPEVAEAVELAKQRLGADLKSAGVTLPKVLAELSKIAFSDIRKVVKWRSNAVGMVENPDTGEQEIVSRNEVALIDSAQLSDDAAASISEVGQSAQGALKIKLYDKRAALVELGRYLGMTARAGVQDGDAKQGTGAPPPETDEFAGLLN